MPTRFKTLSKKNYGVQPLPSGYEKTSGLPDYYINSCGLEDVDTAMFELFDKEISPQVGGIDSADLISVPIVFAAGEKWAMLKLGRPIRDKTGSLILPLITIMRTEVTQDLSADITKRGINQQVGEIVIKRRLDKSDRDYQSLINKLFLKNQSNLAVNPNDTRHGNQIVVERKLGELVADKDIRDGSYLKPILNNNVFETIVVPTPQFYTINYQVTVWTQYMQHSNQILEKLITSFLPQGQSWRLDTKKGYWFVGTVEGGSFNMETSFDDMSTTERFIKHNFTVTVPAYFFATQTPGTPVPIKRYVSSPTIAFKNLSSGSINIASEIPSNKYLLGSDDPTLPLDLQRNVLDDQRTPGWRQQKIYPVITSHNPYSPGTEDSNDPSLSSVPRGHNFIKTVSTTSKGETVYSGHSLGGLEIVLISDN
jgi:hypothetical protein